MDCITPFVNHCRNRQKALLHIYHSVQREVFLNELDRLSFYVVTQYVDAVTSELSLRSEDKTLLIRFYKCTLVGIILDWMNEGMRYDLLAGFDCPRILLPARLRSDRSR